MALTIGNKKAINGNAIFNATMGNVLPTKTATQAGSGGSGGLFKSVVSDAKSLAGKAGSQVKSVVEGALAGLTGPTGGKGTSASTKKATNPYEAAVTASAAKLATAEGAQPGAYQPGYQQQIDSLLNEILTTKKFNYNMDADPLYQQYKSQYMRQGNQAMRDTMGQAAALTGGYGSSYASTAGNQAYQNYLGQLNEVTPQLYQTALSAYEARNNRLQNQLSALQSAENQDYSRWQDQYSRWQDDRDYWYQKNQDDMSRRDSWKG